ncbi:hypothetical protein T10_570 [Trichinella papuae]|uniref:PiggyBac transposable element-derived protein domain-containing protein n=1 Tax=Trichinella papuae TaxID=268474 RepID=A0A0V1M140_9BILA|nr:hypothetical protein T10_1769 [Trichinella papuae]KRZ65982.1 hypothetical protein T10_570 [Trichinella papuae]
MASANGYPYAFKIYGGSDEKRKNEPLGMQIMDEMVSILERLDQDELHFNSSFASYELLQKLTGQKIRETGNYQEREGMKVTNCQLRKSERRTEGFLIT